MPVRLWNPLPDSFVASPPQIFGLIDMVVMIVALSPMLGTRPEYLPFSSVNQVAPLSLVAEITSTWSVALLKTSIAVMLLRFQRTQGWARFLYLMIGVQVVTAAFVTIMQSTRCIPIQGLWDPTITDKRCWSEEAFMISLTVASVLVIVTDVVYAAIPLTFLRHIRRSMHDRLIIGFLMSLGLFASAASVVKTVMVQRFNESDDHPGHGMSIALWASIEAQVGIIAACIPCLRAPFLRLLGRLGISTESSSGGTGGKSAWQSQSLSVGHANPKLTRLQGGTERRGDCFSSTRGATKHVAVDSDEDILVSSGGGRSVREDRIEVNTSIDIELASVTTTGDKRGDANFEWMWISFSQVILFVFESLHGARTKFMYNIKVTW